MAIGVEGQDELGRLAQQIDEMRLYAYENQQAERRASQVNHDLITSMSHDIRTPLATLKRDLEILSLKKGEEERQAFYIQRCLKKTDELIDLSEALFKQSLHVSDSKELHMGKMAIQEIIALLNQIDDLKNEAMIYNLWIRPCMVALKATCLWFIVFLIIYPRISLNMRINKNRSIY